MAFTSDPSQHSYPRMVTLHRTIKNENDLIVTIVIGDISVLSHLKNNAGQDVFWTMMKNGQNIYLESMDEINLLWSAMDDYYKSALAAS